MSSRATHHPHHKKRSTALAIVIILAILQGLFLTLLTIGQKNYLDGEVIRPFILALFGVASLLHAIAGFALWRWKKWGLNLYLIASLGTAAVYMLSTGLLMGAFAALTPVAVVGYVVRLNWRQFE